MKVLTQSGRKQRIDVLRFSPAGDFLMTCGNGSWLDLWRWADATITTRVFETTNSHAWIADATFIGNGAAVVATCGVDGLRIHPTTPGSAFQPTQHTYYGSLRGLAISPDEQRIITSTGCIFAPRPPGNYGYQSWLAQPKAEFRPEWFVENAGQIGRPTFVPSGDRFITSECTRHNGEPAATLWVCAADTGERIAAYPCPYAHVGGLTFSPKGEWLLAGSRMGLLIWPFPDLSAKPKKLLNDNRKHFTDLAFHPSGRYLAAASNDATIKLYDTATWEVARTFTWDIGRMRSVAFSPDGALAAAGSDKGKVVVWDVDV